MKMTRRFDDLPRFPLWFKFWWAFIVLMNVALWGFGIWVVIKLLQHFGVI